MAFFLQRRTLRENTPMQASEKSSQKEERKCSYERKMRKYSKIEREENTPKPNHLGYLEGLQWVIYDKGGKGRVKTQALWNFSQLTHGLV